MYAGCYLDLYHTQSDHTQCVLVVSLILVILSRVILNVCGRDLDLSHTGSSHTQCMLVVSLILVILSLVILNVCWS